MLDHAPSVAAIVWDMDGTLIDSATIVPDAFIATAERLSDRTFDRREVVAFYSLGEPAVMLTRMLDRPSTPSDVAAYHAQLEARAASIRVHEGIAETLECLAAKIPMAVFTGASREAACLLLTAAGIEHHFAAIVGGDQVARPKPEADGIIAACAALGLDPRSCAYIGDAPADMEAADRSGALAVAAGWGHLYQRASHPGHLVLSEPADALSLLSSRSAPSARSPAETSTGGHP